VLSLGGFALVLALQFPILPPLPPPPCLPVPLPPPFPPCSPPPASPGDAPPQISGLEVAKRHKRMATLTWRYVSDDKGIVGFRIYRDNDLLGSRGPAATKVKVFIPCGRHQVWVQVVDTANQAAAARITLSRRCEG
jgi:hypothetical protein